MPIGRPKRSGVCTNAAKNHMIMGRVKIETFESVMWAFVRENAKGNKNHGVEKNKKKQTARLAKTKKKSEKIKQGICWSAVKGKTHPRKAVGQKKTNVISKASQATALINEHQKERRSQKQQGEGARGKGVDINSVHATG